MNVILVLGTEVKLQKKDRCLFWKDDLRETCVDELFSVYCEGTSEFTGDKIPYRTKYTTNR